ncbi:A7L3B protein, partial [Thinocorus orbignyianus]|nr:A7L3B protein [Thinocorus orbignyianus]
MEDMSLSGLDNSKLEAIAHEIYTDLVEDACLGLCFEVHRAVKCGYFFLDDTDPDSMKDFGVQPVEEQGVRVPQLQPQHRRLPLRPPPGEVPGHGPQQQPHRQP